MIVTSYHSQLPAGNGAPEWVHLVPSGRFTGADGRGPYVLPDPEAVIAASMAGGARLAIDENHSTDLAAPQGQPSPARGWIVQMESRADGLWGRVEWTEAGTALMADRAYSSISPVFVTDKAGRVQRVLRAALTNTPNLTQLAKLNHQENTMDLATIRTLLGLGQDADEAAIAAAIAQRDALVTAHAAQIDDLRTQLATSVQPDVVTTLQAQIATLQAEGARTKATVFVDGQIAAGKPIAPLRDHYIARHMVDAAAVETEIGKLPSLHSGGIGGQTTVVLHGQDDDGLTEMEARVCQTMGLPKKAFAEQKKKKAA